MKKFLPYKSLCEQEQFIDKMIYIKNKKDKPLISNEVANKINYILKNYNNEILHIKFYYDGYIYTANKTLYKIDTMYKKIFFSRNEYININDIIDIEVDDFNFF